MPLRRLVDGVVVDFTPEEEAAYLAANSPPPEVSAAVDMRQARLKLLSEPHGAATRLDAVDAYVDGQPANVRIEWEYARELRRDHPMVGIMGLFFGLSSDDLDQWFIEAAGIGPTVAV